MPDVRLIDADATKEKLSFAIEPFIGSAADEIRNDTLLKAIAIVDSMPTVEEQPVKHGHWIRKDIFYVCSECSIELIDDWFEQIAVFPDGYMPLCPNCSAKMEGVKNGDQV